MISANLGLLRSAMWNSYEHGVAFRNEKSGAGSIRRVDLTGAFVGVCISLLDDVDLSRAADRVDAMALAVIEDVVGIAGDIDLCNHVARFGVEHDKL